MYTETIPEHIVPTRVVRQHTTNCRESTYVTLHHDPTPRGSDGHSSRKKRLVMSEVIRIYSEGTSNAGRLTTSYNQLSGNRQRLMGHNQQHERAHILSNTTHLTICTQAQRIDWGRSASFNQLSGSSRRDSAARPRATSRGLSTTGRRVDPTSRMIGIPKIETSYSKKLIALLVMRPLDPLCKAGSLRYRLAIGNRRSSPYSGMGVWGGR